MDHRAVKILRDYFDQNPDERAASTATDTDIKNIIVVIGRSLPAEYVEFLILFGCAMIGDKVILGVSSAPGMFGVNSDLITYNLEAQELMPWLDAGKYLIFSYDDIGNNYAFDCLGCVCFCDHEERVVRKRFLSFSDWLLGCVVGGESE